MAIGRTEIINAVSALFIEFGPKGWTMRGLAQELGVTAPAIYRYFPSKDAVVMGVLTEAYNRNAQYLYKALVGTSPFERFRLAGKAQTDFALAHPHLYLAMHSLTGRAKSGEFPDEVQQLGCAIGQFWRDRVLECMEDGYFVDGAPEEVGRTLWAHHHGLFSLYLLGLMPMSEEEFRKAIFQSGRMLISGLGTEKLRREVSEAETPDVQLTA